MKYVHAFLALLLCSCAATTQTKNPAQSYANTQVFREKDGALQVVADWDAIALSTTTDPPMAVLGGLKGRIVGGKCAYAYYIIDCEYQAKAGSMQVAEEDISTKVRELPYTRGMLEQAAQGQGLHVPLPQWRTRQVLSAAYVRGFLQKIDETLAHPPTALRPSAVPWYRR
ncbi:hypothetical protein [Prosthecobacter sp.]|uniref:hypothetical protein n=1 Tax=Prosthecobacter sp. TaxID=1965333 RepID=UPI002AB8ED05|nr:hypothetical protein [Prosthecobacter sp.]MDZ4405968.1 hypothetical protein [Prosthecobacter sp.]